MSCHVSFCLFVSRLVSFCVLCSEYCTFLYVPVFVVWFNRCITGKSVALLCRICACILFATPNPSPWYSFRSVDDWLIVGCWRHVYWCLGDYALMAYIILLDIPYWKFWIMEIVILEFIPFRNVIMKLNVLFKVA